MQKKKGISLIVLVITIIVMIILAGAIIISLNNSGIIGKANEAVDKTNEAQLKQLASLLWAEAYADGARTQEELDAKVKEGLQNQNISLEDYYVEVTTSGVEVGKRVWEQVGLTVTDGKQVLNIGDTVAYDETNNGAITNLAATDWKVLGASDKGELLIMSTADIVEEYRLGYEDDMTTDAEKLAESQKDYATGVQQLNDLCLPYKGGKGATGARSITVEDVNKITGYNPETVGFGKGELYQYGNEVTYYWDGTDKPAYKSSVVNGSLTGQHNLFMWYDEDTNSWVTSQKSTTATTTTPELITATNNFGMVAKLKSNIYWYSTIGDTGLDIESNAFQMLFGEDGGAYYWLASRYVRMDNEVTYFGIRFADGGGGLIDYSELVHTDGGYSFNSGGVRAVVSLSNDIVLTGSSETGWSF